MTTKMDVWVQSTIKAPDDRPCLLFFRMEADRGAVSSMEMRFTRDELVRIRAEIDRVLAETEGR